ncbi:uncharacterized protein LOC113343905 [Papaver somniferum]|uniref:uncharacterized protein LOC113343905 n=1 Tax=Papaver somniferum TaxID=3469 RepID=UPI000E6FBF50|nr:uncharacterized protein LOC113343905 [Papaver somniferum]
MDREDLVSEANNYLLLVRGRSTDRIKKNGGYGKGRGRSKSRTRLQKDECAWCHDFGHWAKDCTKRKAREGYRDGTWVLDTRAKYHICPYRDCFSCFEELYREVRMGNNHTCRVIGIGSVRIKMHDDMVSELKEGIRHHNLYYLIRSTTIGDVSISEHIESATTEKTKLWHMRLAHPGEKSLHRLIQQDLLKGAITCKLAFSEHCVKGKKTRTSFVTTIHNTSGVLDYVYSYVWGPSKNASLGRKHCENKLDFRAVKLIFVGMKSGVKGFKIWNPIDKNIVMSRDVTFDEMSMLKSRGSRQVKNRSTSTSDPLHQVEIDETPPITVKSIYVQNTSEDTGSAREVTTEVPNDIDDINKEEHESLEDREVTVTESITTSKPRRSTMKPGWMNDYIAYALPVV